MSARLDSSINLKSYAKDRLVSKTSKWYRAMEHKVVRPSVISRAVELYVERRSYSQKWKLEALGLTDLTVTEIADLFDDTISPDVVSRYYDLFWDVRGMRSRKHDLLSVVLSWSASHIYDRVWKLYALDMGHESFIELISSSGLVQDELSWFKRATQKNMVLKAFMGSGMSMREWTEETADLLEKAPKWFEIDNGLGGDNGLPKLAECLQSMTIALNTGKAQLGEREMVYIPPKPDDIILHAEDIV
jgi:hypothetical protein